MTDQQEPYVLPQGYGRYGPQGDDATGDILPAANIPAIRNRHDDIWEEYTVGEFGGGVEGYATAVGELDPYTLRIHRWTVRNLGPIAVDNHGATVDATGYVPLGCYPATAIDYIRTSKTIMAAAALPDRWDKRHRSAGNGFRVETVRKWRHPRRHPLLPRIVRQPMPRQLHAYKLTDA